MDNRGTILVIEDEINLRMTLTAILQRAGFNVTSSARVDEAKQHLNESCYDLVFLDLKTPDQGSSNLVRELNRIQPGIPVILLTPMGFEESPALNNGIGAVAYLFKPFDPARIVAFADEVLKKRPKDS